MQTQTDIVFEKIGVGLKEVEQRLGWPYKRLWNWKDKGLIPQEWHQPLIDRCAEVGVELDPTLFVAHLQRPAAVTIPINSVEKEAAHGAGSQ